jgi:crotonobetainyl-CoA:carnitine CoA-transferase CaiB-like acyl-CoA transferase
MTPSTPLSGVRVLDLTRVLAGPLAAMALGDLGADVIKVERPGAGDETRGWGPPFDGTGEAAYFLAANRNKRSLTADLDAPDDQALLHRLLAECDVVVENFLPGALARRGFDPASMVARHPRLIWCTIAGFERAPDRPGYDLVVQAEAGWMSVTGEPDGSPVKAPVAWVDVLTGKDATIAILAALVGRERGASAADRHLTLHLDRSARAALVNVAQNVLVGGRDAARWGNAHANLVPYQLVDAADRPFVLAVGADAQWRALVALVGDPALDDPAWATNAGRVRDRARCIATLQRALATRPAADWLTACQAAGIPAGLVRTVREALADTDASPRTGLPSSVGGAVHRPPPTLGQHTAEIRAHGWSAPPQPDRNSRD